MTGWKIHDEDAFPIETGDFRIETGDFPISMSCFFFLLQGCTVANSKAVSVHPDTEPGGVELLAV